MQRSALCRSRRELSNEYLLAKFGFDTAENEPFQVCPLSAYRSPRFGQTPLHHAAMNGQFEACAVILKFDKSLPKAVDSSGQTPIKVTKTKNC